MNKLLLSSVAALCLLNTPALATPGGNQGPGDGSCVGNCPNTGGGSNPVNINNKVKTTINNRVNSRINNRVNSNSRSNSTSKSVGIGIGQGGQGGQGGNAKSSATGGNSKATGGRGYGGSSSLNYSDNSSYINPGAIGLAAHGCIGSVSGNGGNSTVVLSFGFTRDHDNCYRLQVATHFWNMGLRKSSIEVLCSVSNTKKYASICKQLDSVKADVNVTMSYKTTTVTSDKKIRNTSVKNRTNSCYAYNPQNPDCN